MITATTETSEKQMLALILKKLEKIGSELSELAYLGEEQIKEDFIKSVEQAGKRVKEGNVKCYSSEEFEKKFPA